MAIWQYECIVSITYMDSLFILFAVEHGILLEKGRLPYLYSRLVLD